MIQTCFIDHSQVVIRLTAQTVNKKEILNEDLVYDLVNYTVGTIKCFTQSEGEVQREAVRQGYIVLLSRCLDKALLFGKNASKRSQMLVQVTGALRNLVNDEDSYARVCKTKVVPKLLSVLDLFRGHKELMLNVSRILSKVSMDSDCSKAIIATDKLVFLNGLITEFQTYTAFVVRIAFVLANLTTYFDEAREQLGTAEEIRRILQVSIVYFEREEAGAEQQVSVGGNVEDTLVKLIRLVANICTDEQYIEAVIDGCGKDLLTQFMAKMVSALERKRVPNSEEFILNAVSCATNMLFFDTPSSNTDLFPDALRVRIFRAVKLFTVETSNEELQIEAVRVLSNLSRHEALCEAFVADIQFVEAMILILDHTLRELVFYTIGILINVTMHEAPRRRFLGLQPALAGKLADVLRDANIEDMDLSKVTAKALHNLAVDREAGAWPAELIKRLDEILSSLGEELDSIMVRRIRMSGGSRTWQARRSCRRSGASES